MTTLIEPNWYVHYKIYVFMVIVVIQDGLNSRTKLSIETSENEERPQNLQKLIEPELYINGHLIAPYQRMLYMLIKYAQCREYGIVAFKKSLKIPKAQSETVNRRTDNMMTKRKRTKGQTMIYKALHRKLYIKIYQHKPHLKPDVNSCAPEG